MPNLRSSAKRMRQSEQRRVINQARKSDIKTAMKKVERAIEEDAPEEEARKLLSEVAAKLSRAKSKGVLHRNTAARRLSRMTRRVNEAYQ